MISIESLNPEWIKVKRAEFKADPIIIEKVIRALILLESLKSSNLNFIFKGGTALMLMIQEPRRFSIDIDIIIEDKEQNIDKVLDEVVVNTGFTKWEEHKRKSKSDIEKQHFKLHYTPISSQEGSTNNILLDIVYEPNPYLQIQEIDVSHFLLKEEKSPLKVVVPTLEAILGDKLTAYGPNTTGVPLSKPKEVMKQIYDVAGIFDRITSIQNVRDNFINVAKSELAYKGFNADNFQIIIDDIINCSFYYCSYGKYDANTFKLMQEGVSGLNNFIYGDKFRQPQAQIAVAKASYLAKIIEKEQTDIIRFDVKADMSKWTITSREHTFLNKLKKHNLEAFHYWCHVFLE